MAGFKRGGFRGGSAVSKKGYAKKRSSPDDDDSAPRASKKAKADEDDDDSAGAMVPKLDKDDEGNQYISLNTSGRRRVTISDFKKNTLVSIREYYLTDGGELKPGKKGISLTIDQYNTLLASAPLLESVLTKKDIEVVRPVYDAEASAEEMVKEEEEPDVTPDVTPEADEARVNKVDDDEE